MSFTRYLCEKQLHCVYTYKYKNKIHSKKLNIFAYLSDSSFHYKLGLFRDTGYEQTTNAAAGFLGR